MGYNYTDNNYTAYYSPDGLQVNPKKTYLLAVLDISNNIRYLDLYVDDYMLRFDAQMNGFQLYPRLNQIFQNGALIANVEYFENYVTIEFADGTNRNLRFNVNSENQITSIDLYQGETLIETLANYTYSDDYLYKVNVGVNEETFQYDVNGLLTAYTNQYGGTSHMEYEYVDGYPVLAQFQGPNVSQGSIEIPARAYTIDRNETTQPTLSESIYSPTVTNINQISFGGNVEQRDTYYQLQKINNTNRYLVTYRSNTCSSCGEGQDVNQRYYYRSPNEVAYKEYEIGGQLVTKESEYGQSDGTAVTVTGDFNLDVFINGNIETTFYPTADNIYLGTGEDKQLIKRTAYFYNECDSGDIECFRNFNENPASVTIEQGSQSVKTDYEYHQIGRASCRERV